MNMANKVIKGTYNIVDCEHYGDIEAAKIRLQKLNVDIKDVFWDGHDCGCAYIEFTFYETEFARIYNALQDEATYNVDVNQYIDVKLPKTQLDNLTCLTSKEFNKLCEEKKCGLSKRVYIYVFFEVTKNVNIDNVINEAIKSISERYTKIEAYNKKIVDGSVFLSILFSVNLHFINEDKIKKFGTNCIANGSDTFLKRNHIYGEMKICSILANCKQKDFKKLYLSALQHKEIQYKDCQAYYALPNIMADFKQYFDGETQKLKEHIIFNDRLFKIF